MKTNTANTTIGTQKPGQDLLNDAVLNRDTAFTTDERKRLNRKDYI
jgi:hypothetical protein